MHKAVVEKMDVGLLLELYDGMLKLREFELKVQELYRRGLLPGFVHLYLGEEAVAVGVCSNLEPKDLVYSTHRGHGHALAKGLPARDVLAELWGKTTGCSGGRGGSMHLYAPEYGFMGTNGIVAAGIPLATGAALSAKLRKSGQVAVAFFGDGAVNTGSFHESLNFGALWNLPVVYVWRKQLVRDRNGFDRATKNTSVQSRAAAYKMLGVEVDGNDVTAVYDSAKEAVRRARSDGGPTLLECKTYRIVGHHEGDPGTDYRTKEQVDEWKSRCPIRTLRDALLDTGRASAETLKRIDEEVKHWLDDAVQFAKQSPQPLPSTVGDHVFGR